MNSLKLLISLIVVTLSCLPLTAQPDLGSPAVYDGVRCFTDIKNKDVVYYAPGALSIKRDRNSKPDFNFIETRYTGNITYGDRGEHRFLSYLRFRVKMDQIPADKLSRIKKAIWPDGNGHLRPAPITNIKTVLVFTPVSENNEQGQQEVFTNGNLSADGPEGINEKGEFWREREFSLKLDNYSAQLLSKAFENGQPLISLSYAFFSEGVTKTGGNIITEGENKILNEIEKSIKDQQDTLSVKGVCIFSDAFAININVNKWPGLVRKIDINEQIPPGYAALEVRCYDFNDDLRPDLFAKKIEIKAEGVGRGEVVVKKTFSRKYPDIYVYNIQFPYAVRIDKPFYYRVTSISDNSPPVKTDWQEQSSWTEMIDITSTENEITDNIEDQ